MFSSIDLSSGYHQIEIDKKSRDKTAYITSEGLYQFKRMPFGLCNALSTFQKIMNDILKPLLHKTCMVYMDDIIVFSKCDSDHTRHVEEVLRQIKDAGLTIKFQKSEFFKKSKRFLEYVISDQGISTDPEKVKAVKDWKKLSNRKELQSFLGFASYYRKFVRNFAKIAYPLTQMLRRDRKWEWSKECEDSLNELKYQLVSAPILKNPDWNLEFIVDTDASNEEIGCVISQIYNGIERPVQFLSRVLSKEEKNYSTTRKELLAVVWSLKQLKPYLIGQRFTIRSDHNSLQWLMNFKEPSGQMARWFETLSHFNFKITYRNGKLHSNADGLSRILCSSVNIKDSVKNIRKGQIEDTNISRIMGWLINNNFPKNCSNFDEECTILYNARKQLKIIDGMLYRVSSKDCDLNKYRVVIPKSYISILLDSIHRIGHLGFDRLLHQVRKVSYWPKQRFYVKNWIESCLECCKRNRCKVPKNLPNIVSDIFYPMERIGIDIVGPMPVSSNRNKFILVICDYFTKYCEAIPMKDQESVKIIKKLFKHFIARFGIPKFIHSDRGTNFESNIFKGIMSFLEIKKTRTTAYYPQSNGLVEKFNKTLIDIISKSIERDENWDEAIPYVIMAYRNSIHKSTGISPNELMLGRKVKTIKECMVGIKSDPMEQNSYLYQIKNNIIKYQQKALKSLKKIKDDTQSSHKINTFQKGDVVWARNHLRVNKLDGYWKGPFIIKKNQQ